MSTLDNVLIERKSGVKEKYDQRKVENAILLASYRTKNGISEEELSTVVSNIERIILPYTLVSDEVDLTVEIMHGIVARALSTVNKEVHSQYLSYKNYKAELLSYSTIMDNYLKMSEGHEVPGNYLAAVEGLVSDTYHKLGSRANQLSVLHAVIQEGIRNSDINLSALLSAPSGVELLLGIIDNYY